jgi:hypothetical protein
MKLLIYAERLCGTARIKVLLNFSHVFVSSLDLSERAKIARWTIKSKSGKNNCQQMLCYLAQSAEAG